MTRQESQLQTMLGLKQPEHSVAAVAKMRHFEFKETEDGNLLYIDGIKAECKLSPWSYQAGVGASSESANVNEIAYLENFDEIEKWLRNDFAATDAEIEYVKVLFNEQGVEMNIYHGWDVVGGSKRDILVDSNLVLTRDQAQKLAEDLYGESWGAVHVEPRLTVNVI